MVREKRVFLALAYIYMELSSLVSGAIVYPSLHWSFQNPRFQEGILHLNVLPSSKLNIICPHVAVSLVEKEDVDDKPNYENFWRVDNTSYQSCNVNTNVTENKIFLRCDNPRQMQFEKLVFQSRSADSSRVFVKGRTYYFISTSNGSLNSLDNKGKGHCLTANMKMELYVCTGLEDPACEEDSNSNITATTSTGETDGTPISGPVGGTQAPRISPSWDSWHLLTIIFGVGFAVSLVIHSICLFLVCRRRKSKKLPGDEDKCGLNTETDEKGLENFQINDMNSLRRV